MKWLWMSVGGVLGVLARYLMGGWVARWAGLGFPWGTIVVNVSGCALIGFLASMGKTEWAMGPSLRAFLFIGFLGAYTTFSTYMLESYELLNRGDWVGAAGNLFGSVFLGMAGFLLGIYVARAIVD